MEPVDITEIEQRVFAIGKPWSQRTELNSHLNNEASLSQHLLTSFQSNFLIWNLSDSNYDYSLFENQVVRKNFLNSTSLSLFSLIETCQEMALWLEMSPTNVVIVHCTDGIKKTCI